MPAKPCEALAAEPARHPPPWPEQRPPLPPLQSPWPAGSSPCSGEAEAQRPLYLSLAQQVATRTCRGPGASSLACGYRQSHGPSTFPLGERHFPREGAVAASPGSPKENPCLPGENLVRPLLQILAGTGCSEVFSHPRFPTIPAERSNHAQSRHRTKEIFTCCAQRLPVPRECTRVPQQPGHPQLLAAASAPAPTPTRDPGSQRRLPPPTPGLCCPQRASSQGFLFPTTRPSPLSPRGQSPQPCVAQATPGSPSHPWVPVPPELAARGDGRNVLVGSMTLPANKRSKPAGLSQLEEYGS